jgi:hypothetical protein
MKRVQRTCLSLLAAGAALAGGAPRAGAATTLLRDARQFVRQCGKLSGARADQVARQIVRGPADLRVQRAAARREGIPLTPRELQAPLPPPDRNAAPVYAELERLLQAKPLDPATNEIRRSLGVHVAHPAEDVARLQKLLAERQDVMALVHAAAGKPDCVLQRDWSPGAMTPLPKFAAIGEAARLLKAESFFLAREGRYREAVENQALGFRVAAHGAAEPALINYLFGMACEAITLSGMENILCLAGPDAAVAEAVREAVTAHRLRIRVSHVFKGEVVLALITYDAGRKSLAAAPVTRGLFPAPSTGGPVPGKQEKLSPRQREIRSRMNDATEAAYLAEMRGLLARCEQPYPALKPFLQSLQARGEHPSWNPIQELATMLPSVYGQAFARATELRAREAALLAGASLLAYRAQHEQFPDQWSPALPAVPRDPFTEKALQYRREGDGCVVYSVGAEGRFDGGRPGSRRDNRQAYFRYPPTPYPPDQPAR